MVELSNKLYRNPAGYLDFTYGYPERINPLWIKKLQTSVPESVFENNNRTRTFIESISNYFKNTLHVTTIDLAPSAGYAFCFACDALIQKAGDEIILQDVSFEPYPKVVEAYKGKAVVVDRNPNASISIQNIKNAYTKRTRAIVLVNPDNPLGLIYSEEELKELASFCVEKNITFVIDYTFFQVSPYSKQIPLVTALKESDALSYMLIGDTGKILGLNGSKFGVLAYSDNWAQQIPQVISNYQFQHNQYNLYLIATVLTDKRFSKYLKDLNSLIGTNYSYIKSNLHPPLIVHPTDATVFCRIDVTSTGKSDVVFAHQLLDEHIGVTPMSYFHQHDRKARSHEIRISLARPTEEITQLVQLLIALRIKTTDTLQ